MVFVTWFTILVLHTSATQVPHTWPVTLTLSESYWSREACEAHLPAMQLVVETLVRERGIFFTGGACEPYTE